MIISRTPFRISFFGGGSDYPAWSREHGGAVLATAIDKYCYLTCRYLPPFFEHRIRVLYSKIETVLRVEDVEHPAVRGALQELGINRGIEIHHDGDLPARSGMGSSSSFAVGILHALHALEGRMRSKHQLAVDAIRLEQEVLRETVGSQDQVAAAFGGFNTIRFLPDGTFSVAPVFMPEVRMADFKRHLMLFFTGISRTSSEVAATFAGSLNDHAGSISRFVEMVDEGLDILSGGRIEDFGHLLDEAWQIKRSLSSAVTTSAVDEAYALARGAGALGGKLLGAGGGGFLLIFTPPERRRHVEKALSHFLHVPFDFEPSGSQIVLYDPEQDYSEVEKNGKWKTENGI
jgi:D-glycero-alpha-D-manno-heptose-7-phosphate kinase